jgi:methylenetetrahydrofolate dehydrogenase (NADP+) / methenyltetrahydrofolate cyclohydrolase
MILDWRAVAATILEGIKSEITFSWTRDKSMLAVVLVGNNPSSEAYIRMKEKRAREVGMAFGLYRFPDTISQDELESEIRSLSWDDRIHGLLVQAPLPAHIDRYSVTECIEAEKDVDGFTRTQIGNMFLGHAGLWSCTPQGIMTMLAHYDIAVRGQHVVVLGRSNIVGKPMTLMLMNAGATVTSCNSATHDLAEITRSADIVIVAIGKPGFLTRDMVSEKSIIIDVGSTFIDGVGRGDADYENLQDYVSAISPVPGGVGPMTVATLIENTWKAYQARKNTMN